MGRESFYGLLASMRGWQDADFAEFYCPDNGRDSVPPSLLATALLLQSHEATRGEGRHTSAWRWGLRRFAKSTLQCFAPS